MQDRTILHRGITEIFQKEFQKPIGVCVEYCVCREISRFHKGILEEIREFLNESHEELGKKFLLILQMEIPKQILEKLLVDFPREFL